MAFKFTFIIFFLIFPFFSSPLLSQSEDGFLDDFGGESFSELEAEIDFETAEIFVDKDVSLDLEVSKEPSFISSFSNTGTISQKLVYGLDNPESPFLRSSTGIDNFISIINLQTKFKSFENINFKFSGDVSWAWGSFKNSSFKYEPTSASFKLRDLYLDYLFENGLWLKFGNQIVARGESNILVSTDVVNPRDLSTIGLQDLDDIRLQVPAVLLNYSFGPINQEFVAVIEAGRNKLGEAGSAFDPLAPFGGATVVSNISRPSNSLETILRNKLFFSGIELVLSLGEYNRKSLSTTSTVVSGASTTFNTEQDRISYFGLSGNMARSNFVFKFDLAQKVGKRFPYSNPLTSPWAKHDNTELGLVVDYTGISDTAFSLELGSSYIHNHSSLLSNKEQENGFLVRVDWRRLNDLLTISATHSKLLGDNGSFSTVGASYDYSDELNISGKMISYDSDSNSQILYPYRKQDLVELKVDYSF